MNELRVCFEFSEWFKQFTGGKLKIDLEVKQGTIAIEALKSIGIPENEVGFITLANESGVNEKRVTSNEYVLRDGDKLKVYTYIIGG